MLPDEVLSFSAGGSYYSATRFEKKKKVSVSYKMYRHNTSRNCCFKGLVIGKIN